MVYVDKGEDWWSVDASGLCVCVCEAVLGTRVYLKSIV